MNRSSFDNAFITVYCVFMYLVMILISLNILRIIIFQNSTYDVDKKKIIMFMN